MLVGQAALSLAGGVAGTWSRLGDGLSILGGCALVTGTLTPAAGVLAAGLSLVRVLAPRAAAHPLEGGAALGLLCLMGLSVALLGPGAFSVDARLFGRREIVVPRATQRSR